MLFLHLRWSCVFSLLFCYYSVSHWLIFLYVAPILHSWDKFCLAMWYNPLYAAWFGFFFFCFFFFEDFCLYNFKQRWSLVCCFCCSCDSFVWRSGNTGLTGWIGKCFFLFWNVCEALVLILLWTFGGIPQWSHWSWAFLCAKFFDH